MGPQEGEASTLYISHITGRSRLLGALTAESRLGLSRDRLIRSLAQSSESREEWTGPKHRNSKTTSAKPTETVAVIYFVFPTDE